MEVCLLGTDFMSPNRGCGALGYAAVEIFRQISTEKGENLKINAVVFSTGKLPAVFGKKTEILLIKVQPRQYNFWRIVTEACKKSDFIIDFTGGDSFSDMYGKKRFYITAMLKQVALWSGTPFIMGPQTIGPFESYGAKKTAKHILRKCDYCFVRDSLSFHFVEELTGRTPLLTTDVAFALPYKKTAKAADNIKRIGFNPSGLLWNKSTCFETSKRVEVDYQEYVKKVIGTLSKDPSWEIHLVPHVFSADMQSTENDLRACTEIHQQYPDTIVESGFDTPMEAKSFISGMDVFIGARMHATIAAFSTGVATIPFSYSRKFEGLYHDLNYPYVISGTKISTVKAIEQTLQWVENYTELQEKVTSAQSIIEKKQKAFYDAIKNLIG